MTIKLKLLGVRGSRPSDKKSSLGYGGNSTSFEIVIPDEDFYLFIDGGSGISRRGFELGEDTTINKFHFLITHTHWDHILGLPFFSPLHAAKNHVNFHASKTRRHSFEEIFNGLQKNGNLPIPATQLQAQLKFTTIEPQVPFKIEDKILIETFQLNHQGITLGYKISYKGSSVAIITDNAPIEGNYMGEGMKEKALVDKKAFEQSFNEGLVNFLKDVHTVVVDTHFTESTLKVDWGHSTPPRALELCKKAGNSRLVLFHHAPEDSDQDVNAKVDSILNDAKKAHIEVKAAKEGDVWELCA